MTKIGIIGTGNVAWHLIQGFQKSSEITISWVAGRNKNTLAEFSQYQQISNLEEIQQHPVDLILICVNDDSIQTVVDQLPATSSVAFTSGTVSLENIHFQQKNAGVFYPLQTFTKEKFVSLEEVPFLIESKNSVFTEQLKNLAAKLSNNVSEMNSEERKKLHIAAVFTNNFVNHILLLAQNHLKENQLNGQLLEPLLNETIKKLIELGPHDAQSGPARRNDLHTIETHLNELQGLPKEIYKVISESILKTYNK